MRERTRRTKSSRTTDQFGEQFIRNGSTRSKNAPLTVPFWTEWPDRKRAKECGKGRWNNRTWASRPFDSSPVLFLIDQSDGQSGLLFITFTLTTINRFVLRMTFRVTSRFDEGRRRPFCRFLTFHQNHLFFNFYRLMKKIM